MNAVTVSLTPYLNLGGESEVVAFALLRDSIVLQFRNGEIYLYGPQHPGVEHVERMKELAVVGSGLGRYITREVRDDYEASSIDLGGRPSSRRRH